MYIQNVVLMHIHTQLFPSRILLVIHDPSFSIKGGAEIKVKTRNHLLNERDTLSMAFNTKIRKCHHPERCCQDSYAGNPDSTDLHIMPGLINVVGGDPNKDKGSDSVCVKTVDRRLNWSPPYCCPRPHLPRAQGQREYHDAVLGGTDRAGVDFSAVRRNRCLSTLNGLTGRCAVPWVVGTPSFWTP